MDIAVFIWGKARHIIIPNMRKMKDCKRQWTSHFPFNKITLRVSLFPRTIGINLSVVIYKVTCPNSLSHMFEYKIYTYILLVIKFLWHWLLKRRNWIWYIHLKTFASSRMILCLCTAENSLIAVYLCCTHNVFLNRLYKSYFIHQLHTTYLDCIITRWRKRNSFSDIPYILDSICVIL